MKTTLVLVTLATVVMAAAPVVSAAEPPPLPAGAEQSSVWYAVIDGEKTGPMTDAAFSRKLDDGTIAADTLVWRDGMAAWVRASDTITFKAHLVDARLSHPDRPTRRDNAFIAVRF